MSARQYDVFANTDPESADSHPYFIVLQHDSLRHLNTRIVAPLVEPRKLPLFERLMPDVTVKGARYVIDMTNLDVLPESLLGTAIANFEAEHYHIVRAIGLVFTGI